MQGNGLCKAIAKNQEVSTNGEISRVLMVSLQDPWFLDIAYFLTYGECPNGLTYKKKIGLRTKFIKYVIYDDQLYKREIDGTFLRCVDKP